MEDVHFEGDPSVDSTRRQMERLMKGRGQPRRWPWAVAAIAAGSAAFTLLRIRAHRAKQRETNEDASANSHADIRRAR